MAHVFAMGIERSKIQLSEAPASKVDYRIAELAQKIAHEDLPPIKIRVLIQNLFTELISENGNASESDYYRELQIVLQNHAALTSRIYAIASQCNCKRCQEIAQLTVPIAMASSVH